VSACLRGVGPFARALPLVCRAALSRDLACSAADDVDDCEQVRQLLEVGAATAWCVCTWCVCVSAGTTAAYVFMYCSGTATPSLVIVAMNRYCSQDIESRRQQKMRSGVGMVLEQAKRGEITNAIQVQSLASLRGCTRRC
jgi:hypothetical protein